MAGSTTNASAPRFCCAAHAMGFAAARFTVVSLIAYGIWAFGGRMGAATLYTSIALAFAGLSGLLLFPLVEGSNRPLRFYAIFVPGFLLYAAGWCLGWFGIGGHLGEVFGSALGLALFTLILCVVFKARSLFLEVLGVLFLCHTLGYYLGDALYVGGHGPAFLNSFFESAGGKVRVSTARLFWGLAHGVGFGAGLGYAFYRCQAGRSEGEAGARE